MPSRRPGGTGPSLIPPWMDPNYGGKQGTGNSPTYPSGGGSSGSSVVAAPGVALPKGILPIEFSLQDVAGTVTNSQMFRIIGAAASVVAAQLSYTVPFKGSIVAMSLASTAAKTAGTATFKAFRQGIDTGAFVAWATGVAAGYQTFQVGQFPFSAGESLDIRVTTSGFTPTTADVEAFLYLAQEVV